jgi:pSer/pThr/pTyr-binding forkhead associated (FHA) protein
MPLIRCPKCGQAYNVPGAVAVHLPNSIATCHCGEWIAGSKAAVLARMLDPTKIREIDLQPYRVTEEPEPKAPEVAPEPAAPEVFETVTASELAAEAKRNVLVCIDGALKGQEFELPPTGLVVGREGHVRVPDEYLSRRHFEVVADAEGTVRVRDLGSRNGTFLNTMPARDTKVHPGDVIQAGVNRFRIEQRTL